MEQISGNKGDTWPQILKYNYEKYGDKHRAMRYKHYGIWQPYTWKDYYLNVKYISLGLLSLGFKPGDKLLIIGDNAPQWYYAELAAQANRGVSVGVYSDLVPAEIRYLADNCEASFAIVEDQEQVDKLLQIRHELPLLKKIIYWSYKGLAHYHDPLLMGYRQLRQSGEKYAEEHHSLFEQNVAAGQADDVCALVYTSGTTGAQPKGAMHTYRTMRAGAEHFLQLDPWQENDNIIPYLPPAWMTEQLLGIGCHLLSGSILNFAEATETRQRDTRETGPSIVCHGAGLWESQAAMVQARIRDADAIKKLAFRFLMPLGYKMADGKFQKKNPGLFEKILYSLAEIILFGPIRASLGLQNARICYSTGAILSPDAFRFYHALNLPLKSLYGSTEGGALTGAANDDICAETVGPCHQGTEIKITAKGELIYRQPGMFIGYYQDPEQTARALQDGWFYSGDSAFIREDGHIVFVDRLTNLVKLKSGETLAPQFIESRLKSSAYIQEAWVFAGPERTYAAAVIIINYNHVSRWAGQRRLAHSTFAELARMPEVYELVKQDIARINSALPPGSRVKKYVNLHKEFDPDEGELTRTRKLRRTALEERYRELIATIYSNMAELSIEAPVGHQDGNRETIRTTLTIRSVEGANE